MRTFFHTCLIVLWLAANSAAASKLHVISFGKAITVRWSVGDNEETYRELKVRQLLLDSRPKEFTLGAPHDVTDCLFVIRRVVRINDALPDEAVSARSWRWEPGGWLLVDRMTGHTSPITLPELDPYFSVASWYRDYVAYCGVSEDGGQVSAMVMQLGRRKPLLRKAMNTLSRDDQPNSACSTPVWQRQPARVTFDGGVNQKFTYSVRAHAVEVIHDDENVDPAE